MNDSNSSNTCNSEKSPKSLGTCSVKEKKTYRKPELVEYGTVERKTGGGSGTMTEGSMMKVTRRPA